MDSVQNKIVPVLVTLLVVAAFFIGSLYTRVNMLEKGTSAGSAKGQVAGVGNQPPPVEPTPQPVDITLTDVPVLGNKEAKVALVEFTDYQCPYCGALFQQVLPQLKKEYIETGKAKFIVRDFPLISIHQYAKKSAEASHCAEDQGKFFEYHDVLFQNQTALTADDLKKYAEQVGLNTSQFTSCLDSGKYAARVETDLKDGEKYGVRGTPATFVGVVEGNTVKNAIQISGAQPFSAFKTEIDKLLK